MTSIRAPGKIVIVSQHYAPDPSTTATYLTAIADGLTADREVLVISGTAHSAATARSGKDGPRVVEVGCWTPDKDALVRRASAMVLPYPVTLATRLRHASAILLIYDLYPEALVMAGLVQSRSLVARAIRFAN